MNFYPFHIGDYLSATRHLTWDEDAAFRRLLDAYYTAEKPLPADERQVFRLVVASTDAQREAVRTVLQEFFLLTDAGWVNSRADREIGVMREKQQKQREKANKRWHKPDDEHGNAPAMPRHPKKDATAQKTDADAMPPIPTPIPTPLEIPSVAKATGDPAGPPPIDGQALPPPDPPPDPPPPDPPPPPPPPPPEPPDLRDQVFALGVAMLTGSGVKETSARSFLAMSSKAHGDAAVVAALEACAINKPIQPIPWLQQKLKPVAGRVGKHTGFDQKDYSAGVTNDGQLA